MWIIKESKTTADCYPYVSSCLDEQIAVYKISLEFQLR